MSGYNIAAAGMYGMFPNLYNNQIALNDLTGMDLYSPMGMMMDPMLSMNGSIFGGGMYPVMPMYSGGAYNYEDYYKNYQKYQDFMTDARVRQQQNWREADLKLNSPMEGVAKKATYLHDKIMRNEQQQIQLAYNDFKESVRSLYPEANDEAIANRASTLYAQQYGSSITDDIRKYGRGSFTQGFLQTVTLGLADKKTAEENISELTGQPVGRTETNLKIAGNVAGGVVVGGATAISAKYLLKAFFKGMKNKPLVAGLIGGAIGLVTALSTSK